MAEPGNPVVLAQTTVDDESTAYELGRAAVEARLAAGVDVEARMTSFYWWQGKVRHEREYRLTFKTVQGPGGGAGGVGARAAPVRGAAVDRAARVGGRGGVPGVGAGGDPRRVTRGAAPRGRGEARCRTAWVSPDPVETA
ncbi:divalent cation tolerance protein CutA [Streptomyces sp. CS62]|uniref:divalent cation tolerance protein CutA n=1 Tax=Streptomyces sp. CS62 TaxID=3119268 RepID=UPI003FA7BCB8